MGGGGRFRRGWALTKKSWAVLRADRSLILFPIVSAICAVIALAIFIAPGAALAVADDGREWVVVSFLAVAAYSAVFVGIFFSVALAGCVARALEGKAVSLGEGIRIASGRLGQITCWALIQTTIGALLSLLRDSDAAGIAALAVGAVIIAVPAVIGSGLQAIFRVVLYRFATAGEVVGGFEAGELERAFVPRKRGRSGRRSTV